MSEVLYAAHARGRRILWLLTLRWAGYTIRISDDEVDVETDAGEWLHYHDGLGDLEVEEDLTLGGDSSGTLSVPIETLFPPEVDVARLCARGHRLSSARGELARWVEGTAWESRRVVLAGRLTQPIRRSGDDPVQASMDESIAQDGTKTGDRRLRVVGANWSQITTVPTDQLGEDYAIIIGRPGYVSTDINPDGWITGSSATWVDCRCTAVAGSNFVNFRAEIAGHHVQVGSVWVNGDDDVGGFRVRVANGHDNQGNPVAFLAWFATATGDAPEDDYDAGFEPYSYSTGATIYGLGAAAVPFDGYITKRLYIGWRDEDDLPAGGLTVAGKLVREAGPLLTYLLGKCSAGVDRGAMSAIGSSLARFRFDGVIDVSTNVWEFLRDELLPLLPISIASGPDGLYAILWRFNATRADATVFINTTTDPDCELLGGIEEDDTEIVNRVVVRYAYSYRTKEYAAEITLGARGDVAPSETPATRSSGWVEVTLNAAAGDTVVINGVTLTAVVGAPGPLEFQIDLVFPEVTALYLLIRIGTLASTLGVTGAIDAAAANTRINLHGRALGDAGNVTLVVTGGNLTRSGATMTGGVDAIPDRTFRVSPYCQASRDALDGEVRERIIETAYVYETSTAWAIAETIAAAYSQADRAVFRVPETDFVQTRRGAIALLTDEDAALDEVLAIVTGVLTDGSGSLVLTTRIVDVPGRLYRGA